MKVCHIIPAPIAGSTNSSQEEDIAKLLGGNGEQVNHLKCGAHWDVRTQSWCGTRVNWQRLGVARMRGGYVPSTVVAKVGRCHKERGKKWLSRVLGLYTCPPTTPPRRSKKVAMVTRASQSNCCFR